MRLEGKVAIISGAGPSNGRAIALLFAQEGAQIVAVARSREHAPQTVEHIRAAGGDAHFVSADVTRPDDAERVAAEAMARYARIDILVNTAGGGSRPPFQSLFEPPLEFVDEVLSNNLRGPFLMTKYAAPLMEQVGGGSVINFSAGYKTRRDGNIAYGTAKEGVIGLTRNMARALCAANIRVNAICPGAIRGSIGIGPTTGPILPQKGAIGRLGRPEDVAYLALYLASDESAWVTGQTFVVDGGDEVLVPR